MLAFFKFALEYPKSCYDLTGLLNLSSHVSSI